MATLGDTAFILDFVEAGAVNTDIHKSYRGAACNACALMVQHDYLLTREIKKFIEDEMYGKAIDAFNDHNGTIHNSKIPTYIKISEVIVRP